jgi:SDR family mycofactocin-dependent oxidoreductase
MLDVAGKVALITGAARGQGRSHALTLARAGADVILLDICRSVPSVPYEMATERELEETAEAVRALGRGALDLVVDVRDQAALDDAVARGVVEFGKVDVVVANAGVWGLTPFWELTEEQWSTSIDVNLSGQWRTIKAVTPHLIERRSGTIVMISSVNGIEAGPSYAHYCAAKAGVLALMRNVALELGPYGVRCNAICPGAMDTEMNTWQGALDMVSGHAGGTLEERRQAGRHWSILPGRSVLEPTATSNAVLWLASEASGDVTGVALPVDAGHLVSPGFNHAPV